jgi:hypothetical protein
MISMARVADQHAVELAIKNVGFGHAGHPIIQNRLRSP